jgi:hypothetical protein
MAGDYDISGEASFIRVFNSLVLIKHNNANTNKPTPWPLVRERTIPTDRPPLVDEI